MVEQRSIAKTQDVASNHDALPLRMHPRVFAALGKDLVTNDVVAVMELVKNSYDAFANNVWLKFGQDDASGPSLEIRDDGMGMTRDVIENVWCMIATPFRESRPIVRKGGKQRRVVGAKGLGRLSVARLGGKLNMLTKAPGNPCWEITVDWSDIEQSESLDHTTVACREYPGPSPFGDSGTVLHVLELEERWTEERIDDLKENLTRLISPFSEANDFNIFLSISSENRTQDLRIESSEFLSEPKYRIDGNVDSLGNVTAKYQFSPVGPSRESRSKSLSSTWYNIRQSVRLSERPRYPEKNAHCGPFSFEIRAWDIGPNDTQEISDRFKIRKNLVRKAIRVHKGISVYRDGVLVLPKSENARDWMGLDLRRVGQVGRRVSTSQLVGYVAISADQNPGIVDTSDRERLSSSAEVAEFELILLAIVRMLEQERNADRALPGRERPMADLFEAMTANNLVSSISELAAAGAPTSEAVSYVEEFAANLDETRQSIEERFVYYSRLATVGTIAQMIIHEIRSRTTTLKRFLLSIRESVPSLPGSMTKNRYQRTVEAVDGLEHLADRFAPLANRKFTRRLEPLVLEDRLRACLDMCEADIREKEIKCFVPNTRTVVAVDPAELDTIILNLVTNASYWLGEIERGNRNIEFEIQPDLIDETPRVHISVHDNGPGIDAEDIVKVFLPGVTRKPNGIGMGLNVASELAAIYGGEMKAMLPPAKKGGASFKFDLPLHKRGT